MLPEDRTICLVEDNPDDRFLFERAWRVAGIKNPLRMCADGTQALEYLLGTGSFTDRASHPLPAMILLDIKMPGLSGFEVLDRLRRDEKLRSIPVVMMTASTSPADVSEAYRLGANGFYIKPSSVQELVELLAALRGCWLRFNEFPS